MTKEEKQLLLIDLCARLPYGVIVYHLDYNEPQTLNTIYYNSNAWQDGGAIQCNIDYVGNLPHDMCLCKPYLRSMSSMTAEEKKQYHKLCDVDEEYGVGCNPEIVAVHDTLESLDYLNSIHIDYRGLIPQGLAIEVTEENNPYKD